MASASIPSNAIRILIDAIKSKNYLSFEVFDAAVELGKWVYGAFFANRVSTDDLGGPIAISSDEPLTDELAVERLQSLLPVEGQPEKLINPAMLIPIVLFLVRNIGGALLSRLLSVR